MKLRRCGFIAEDVYLAYRLLDKETDAFGGVCIEICKRRLIALILGCLEPELMKLAVEIGLRLSQELNPIAVYYWFVQAAPVVSPLVNNPQLKSVAPFVIIFFATPSVIIFRNSSRCNSPKPANTTGSGAARWRSSTSASSPTA